MAQVTALALDTDAAGYTRGEGIHFGGFPGVWEPGRPVPVAELGFESVDEALARVDELELPLRQVDVDPDDENVGMPVRPNHLLSEEQQRVIDNEIAANWPPRTHEEADRAAAAAGVEWPRQRMKVDEKVAFLEAARDARVTTEGDDITHNPVNEGEGTE